MFVFFLHSQEAFGAVLDLIFGPVQLRKQELLFDYANSNFVCTGKTFYLDRHEASLSMLFLFSLRREA